MSSQSNLDRPNGDLTIGTFFRITKWVGEREYVDRRGFVTPMGMFVSTNTTHEEKDEDDDKRQLNKALLMDVLEVLAVDHPFIAVKCHSLSGGQNKAQFVLDAREFESSTKIDDGYKRLLVKAKNQ